jgi:hypothetical protein
MILLLETMAQQSNNTLWYVLGGVIAGGIVGVLSYRFYQQRKKPEPPTGGGKASPTPPTLLTHSTPPTGIAAEMLLMLKHFSGSMNSLLDITKDGSPEDSSVVFENLEQIINFHGSEKLKKWFSDFEKDRKAWTADSYQTKAAEMLTLLQSCGIQRSTQTTTVWGNESNKYYRKLTKDIAEGQACEVLLPYWTLGKEVFERGMVRKS